jgi:Tol biopolymer transport system component
VHRFDKLTYILSPEWTPDGNYILVGARPSGVEEGIILYRVPAENGEPQEIVLQQMIADRPTVHPDGRRIAFCTSANSDRDADVWVMQNFLPKSVPKK